MAWRLSFRLELPRALTKSDLAKLRDHNLDPRWKLSSRAEGYSLQPREVGEDSLEGETRIGFRSDYQKVLDALAEARVIFAATKVRIWDDHDPDPIDPAELDEDDITRRTGMTDDGSGREAARAQWAATIEEELADVPPEQRDRVRERLLADFDDHDDDPVQ